MDERERSRIDAVCRYHGDSRIVALAYEISAVTGQFSIAGRLGSNPHAKAIIDRMGEQTHALAVDSRDGVLKLSNSYEACQFWIEFVKCFQAAAFDGWAETIAPRAGRYGPMQPELEAACKRVIADWSDKIDAYLNIGAFVFDDPPTQPRPEIGLDGWPVPGSEATDPAFAEPAPKAEIKRLSDPALMNWWAALGDEQGLPIERLFRKANEDHPNHHVARTRIRALTEGRKRGRPLIGRKATAD